MNKNTTAVILIVLAIGIYFTFTRYRMVEIGEIRKVNGEYQTAIENSTKLVEVRDQVLKTYNEISESDRDRLNKLVPDNVDNVRLIIDVKDDIAARHGLALKNIKTVSPEANSGSNNQAAVADAGEKYGTVSLSFGVTAKYDTFINFLKDLEASLRLMDITRLAITTNTTNPEMYDFTVELKTYWLKQN